MLRNAFAVAREVGIRAAVFRAGWELRNRTPIAAWLESSSAPSPASKTDWIANLPLADAVSVVEAMRGRIGTDNFADLTHEAQSAASGTILGYRHLRMRYGDPIDWQKNPLSGQSWRHDLHWSQALRDEARVGDVKLTWEIGRFPTSRMS